MDIQYVTTPVMHLLYSFSSCPLHAYIFSPFFKEIEVQLVYNVMLVSGLQYSDSKILKVILRI